MKLLLLSLLWTCTHAHPKGSNKTVSTDDIQPTQKIIGGFPVSAGTYPYYAKMSIQSTQGTFLCGSSLVSPEFVLTAAHCTTPSKSIRSIQIHIGLLCKDSGNCGQYSEVKNSKKIFTHPQYNKRTIENDFSLVQLTSRSTIQPIVLDSGNLSPSYTEGKRNLYATGTYFLVLTS
jgi:secreted trypsin-like serine protease